MNDEHEEVESRLQASVNFDEKNALGATPFYWAACILDCITKLADLGADIGARTLKGETALHCAARRGQAEVVLPLLDRGANIQAADLRKRTVLHATIEEGEDNYEVGSLLVERGVDFLATDVDGLTALDFTHGSKQQNIATLLKLKRPLLSPSKHDAQSVYRNMSHFPPQCTCGLGRTTVPAREFAAEDLNQQRFVVDP